MNLIRDQRPQELAIPPGPPKEPPSQIEPGLNLALSASAEFQLMHSLQTECCLPSELFSALCALYIPSQDSKSVDAFLDELPPPMQQQLTDSYLQSLSGQPQFPTLPRVREIIEEHATAVLHRVVSRSSATLCFSGYDSSSSLGRGIPLPGSDIDHWIVVIAGTREQASEIRQNVRKTVNPLVTDLSHSSHAPPLVMTCDDLFSSIHLSGAQDSFYLVRLPLEQWPDAHWKWSLPGSTLSAKPYIHSSERELMQLAKQFADDEDRDNWVSSSCLVETIREGIVLENYFSPDEVKCVSNSKLFTSSNLLKQTRNLKAQQSKHRARGCFEHFNELNSKEQFLLVRVFLENHLRNDSSHCHLFRLNEENPNCETLYSLIQKGFLSYRDLTIQGEVPDGIEQSYQQLLPYLNPGTTAEAPFHNHYPFERSLPFDY